MADPGGGGCARHVHPPSQSKFFHFQSIFKKYVCKARKHSRMCTAYLWTSEKYDLCGGFRNPPPPPTCLLNRQTCVKTSTPQLLNFRAWIISCSREMVPPPEIGFFTNSVQCKNANIASFCLSCALEIKSSPTQSLILEYIICFYPLISNDTFTNVMWQN